MKRNVTASLSLCSDGPRKAPAKVRLWKSGNNPGDYGDCFVTPASVARVMNDYLKRGVSKIIDVEHGLNSVVNPKIDPNNPPVTGGYFDLEVQGPEEAPELWIAPRWSDCGRDAPVPGIVCCAKHQIESGQREYISPDWDLDSETKEPLRLNRVSLVGEPGTYGISMLASASANRSKTMDEMANLKAAYAGAMAMSGSSDPEIKAAAATLCEKLKAQAAVLGIDIEAADAAPAPDAPEALAAAEAPAPAAPPVDDSKKTPMVASADNAPAEKPLTASALTAMLAERDERTAMAADPRLSKEMKNVVASADLKTARAIVKALPALPAPSGSVGQPGPVNHTAGAKMDVALNQGETFVANRYREALGVTAENVTAARKIIDADPDGEGSVTVSLKSLVDKHKARRNPAANAMRFGV